MAGLRGGPPSHGVQEEDRDVGSDGAEVYEDNCRQQESKTQRMHDESYKNNSLFFNFFNVFLSTSYTPKSSQEQELVFKRASACSQGEEAFE